MIEKLVETLRNDGDLYDVKDILEGIASGHMQSFAVNDSLAVTQILVFPKRRVLHILAVAGNWEDLDELYDRVVQFGEAQGVSFVQSLGRKGWSKFADTKGFKPKGVWYVREN